MFLTSNHAKIQLGYIDRDESVWAYAELMLSCHWFFVDCIIKEDNLPIQVQYMLGNISQLKELEQDNSVRIKTIYIISPPSMNLSEYWQMDEVIKCEKVVDNKAKEFLEVFETKEGKKYYSKIVGDSSEITEIKSKI